VATGHPHEVLDLLGEDLVREILLATSQEPMSASQLADECDVAPSTIYRRVDVMTDRELLTERTHIEADGSHHSVYELNVEHVDVDISDGRIDVGIEIREDAAKRFSRIWNDMRET
jgi:DNA-binding transcriptional ArsR family regulator